MLQNFVCRTGHSSMDSPIYTFDFHATSALPQDMFAEDITLISLQTIIMQILGKHGETLYTWNMNNSLLHTGETWYEIR